MMLEKICRLQEDKEPLKLVDIPEPVPQEGEILVQVSTCGVCHTELDEIEGRTPPAKFPVVLGHQIIGRVLETSPKFKKGDRVGIAWIYSTCGSCSFCREGNENLCKDFKATGRDADGGYAEYVRVLEDFVYKIPPQFSDSEAAPLLCAGAVGYRSLKLARIKNGDNLGLAGFGASSHLVIKMARYKYPDSKIFVFARSPYERKFAENLGAFWTGGIDEDPPEKLDSIIDTTPVWEPVVRSLNNLKSGGRLIINAIRKEDIDKDYLLKLDYAKNIWLEKEMKSVANITRRDVREFLSLAAEVPIKPEVQEYSLKDANSALLDIKEKKIKGAKVLRIT